MTIIEETQKSKPEKKSARATAPPNPANTAPEQTETAFYLDPGRVRVSTFNVPHRDPDENLIASVRDNGIIEPGIVRRRPPSIVTEPDGRQRETDLEIVVGERRWKACRLTGRPFVAFIRELTDAEVLDLQTDENLQRADLTPLQEAEVFRAHQVKLDRAPGEIAARVHKSERYVVQRLKLLELPAVARDALLGGRIALGTAIEIACLREQDREEATALVLPRGNESPLTVGHARNVLANRFHLKMVNATFPIGDALLLPTAGACTTCPKRSSNQLALSIEGVDDDDRCLDRACWEGKTAALWARRKALAVAEGLEVLEGDKAQAVFDYPWKKGLVALDSPCEIAEDPREKELLAQIREAEEKGDDARVEQLEKEHDALQEQDAPTWREVLGAAVKPAAVGLRSKAWGDRTSEVVELAGERDVLQAAKDKGLRLLPWMEAKLAAPPPAPAPSPATEPAEDLRTKAKIENRAAELVREESIRVCVAAAQTTPPRPGPAFFKALLHGLFGSGYTEISVNAHDLVEAHGWHPQGGEPQWKTVLREADKLTEQDLRGLLVELVMRVTDEPIEGMVKLFGVDLGKLRTAAKKKAKAEIEGKGKSAPRAPKGKKAEPKPEPAMTREVEIEVQECRQCGCTDDNACIDTDELPCSWVEPDLCSKCAGTRDPAKLAKTFREKSHRKLGASAGPSAEASP